MQLEVLRHIVNDDRLTQVSTYSREVLDKHRSTRKSMLPVESVANEPLRIDLVNNPVCVVLHGCCEDDYFIVLVHLLQELTHSWPDQTLALVALFKVVDEGFVKV